MNGKPRKLPIKDIREKNAKEGMDCLKDDKTSTDNIKYKNEKNLLVFNSSFSNNSQNNYSLNSSLSKTNDQTILANPLDISFSDPNFPFINDLNSNSNLSAILVGDDSVNNAENKIEIPEKSFNYARANYYLKNNLYDILLNIELNIKCPQKYSIADKKYAFVYPNDYTTFSITISGFLSKNKNNDNFITNDKDEKEIQFYPSLGLSFCGKITVVIIGEKKQEKICQPDSFMCKNCVEINKRKYKIKNNYLININGRVAKINKGCYHCFGVFSCGNQIKDCITKFQCKGCKLLQENS